MRAGECYHDGMVLYYSKSSTRELNNGLGIMIKKELHSCFCSFVPYNEQMIMLQLKAHPLNINIIKMYATTSDSTNNEIEAFIKF